MAEPVEVTNNTAESRFEVRLGDDVAFAEYRRMPGKLILPHTVVPPAFEGRGVASALARAAFGHARAEGLAVVPTCPFMAGWVRKHPEEQDIVDAHCKRELGLA